MPVASKIACAITLGVLALNITFGLALPLTSELGQTTDVVRRDPDFTSARITTLVSRTDDDSKSEPEEPRQALSPAPSPKKQGEPPATFSSKHPDPRPIQAASKPEARPASEILKELKEMVAETQTTLENFEDLGSEDSDTEDLEEVLDLFSTTKKKLKEMVSNSTRRQGPSSSG